jgi:hypothetical protein
LALIGQNLKVFFICPYLPPFFKYFFIFCFADITESLGNYWMEEENQRVFFDTAAKELGLDPLVAGTWYGLERADLATFKVFSFLSSSSLSLFLLLPPLTYINFRD